MKKENIPNILTIIRFILIPFIFISVITHHYLLAVIIFTISALTDILDEYDKLGKELEKLRNEGKSKTTKFRELLGKKLVYSMIITIFKRYDLIDK